MGGKKFLMNPFWGGSAGKIDRTLQFLLFSYDTSLLRVRLFLHPRTVLDGYPARPPETNPPAPAPSAPGGIPKKQDR